MMYMNRNNLKFGLFTYFTNICSHHEIYRHTYLQEMANSCLTQIIHNMVSLIIL